MEKYEKLIVSLKPQNSCNGYPRNLISQMLEKGNKTEEEMHINVGRVNRSIALTQRLHCSAIPKVPNWRSTYENCTKIMPLEL